MPRFSIAFAKRKSNTDTTDNNADVTPPAQPSFRVLERNEVAAGRSFDGSARMAKASTALLPKPDFHDDDDNMFSDMKPHNRGSGLSNATHASYTDNSSRYSNASTAPSSADFSGGNVHEENRVATSKTSSPETTTRGHSKSIGSKFLDKAGRTFSFGGQKKHTVPPPMPEDLPPMGRQETPRGTTASTSNTAKLGADPIDLGSDFGSMLPSFDKRASMATVRMDDLAHPRLLTGNRLVQSGQAVPQSPDVANPADPLLSPWSTPQSRSRQREQRPDSPLFDQPPPVPPHHNPSKSRSSIHPAENMSDEETKLLEESYGSVKRLPGQDKFVSPPRRQATSNFANQTQSGGEEEEDVDDDDDDNLFADTTRFSRPPIPLPKPRKPDGPPQQKIMSREEFDNYCAEKARQAAINKALGIKNDDDSSSDDYDDDEEDEAEKMKRITQERRKQQAKLTINRQKMMKIAGNPDYKPPSPPPARAGLPSSISAPQLSHMKGPSALPAGTNDGDDDEDIPLAVLQAHGFPNKNRPPNRLTNMGSNPNIRASVHSFNMGRPQSVVGDASSNRRHSTLPAFARRLPPDPYEPYGANIVRPGLRESMGFGDAGHFQKPPSPLPILPPGGLIGVIANEERSRALRRGSPSVDATMLMGHGLLGLRGGLDPVAGIPHHMMYNQPGMGGGNMQGMMSSQMMPQQQYHQHHPQQYQQQPSQPQHQHRHSMMAAGDQAQSQADMNQKMDQLMQMHMHVMNMMAQNQGSGPSQQQPGGGTGPADFSSVRNSTIGQPAMDSRRADYGMRTMSMVQPSSAPMVHPGYAGSIRSSVHGYTPSIAPSERSNVGLPQRYRPVSQAMGAIKPTAISGALSSLGDGKAKSAMRVVNKSASTSDDDDDDEQGWEAMKTKREKRRSMWKSKKSLSSVV